LEQKPPRSRRDIGVRLASVLCGREGQNLSASSLQGIAADVVAGDEKLILPTRYLISLPIFRQLIPKAGSGTGLAERDAILQDIQETFSPRIAKAVGEVLSGFLGLPDFPTPTSLPTHVASELGQVVDQKASAILLPSQPLCEEAGNVHSTRSRSPARKVLLPAAALLALCTGIILSVKVPPFCTLLGLCASVAPSSSRIALQAAKQAADRLEAAKDLGSFQQASLALDAALLKLSGVELLPEQRTALQNLLTVASAARRRAGQELADRERLLRVREAIASARDASRQDRDNLLTKASGALDGIGISGFAAQDAVMLREQIVSLRQKEPAGPSLESGQHQRETAATPNVTLRPGEVLLARILESDSSDSRLAEGALRYNNGNTLRGKFLVNCATGTITPQDFIFTSTDGTLIKSGDLWSPPFKTRWSVEVKLISQACGYKP